MAKRSRWLLILTGILVGVAGTLLLSGGYGPPAQAQPPAAPPGGGRYQVSSWAVSDPNVRGGPAASHGAYVLDTQTGEVFHVVGTDAPTAIGSVAKLPKK